MHKKLVRPGEKLRAARIRKGLSQDAAGKLVGCSQSAFCNLETGKSLPSAILAESIREHFGIKSWKSPAEESERAA